jgi:hypothetical protein
LAAARPALADQHYDVSGEDVFRVGPSGIVSRVVYAGKQILSVDRQDGHTRYEAQARYQRSAEDGKSSVVAHFVQELLPNGSFEDRVDQDPDFLTILNQPFAVQLDTVTMRDLKSLDGEVPFDAGSPLGGDAVLHGFLRRGVSGEIDGHPALAIRFQADGPMTAPMPDRSGATMSGRMRMDGTAYYALDSAMLLALDATLTILAQLHDGQTTLPVKIVYRRFIRATGAIQPWVPRTPPPTPLATDGGMGSRVAP